MVGSVEGIIGLQAQFSEPRGAHVSGAHHKPRLQINGSIRRDEVIELSGHPFGVDVATHPREVKRVVGLQEGVLCERGSVPVGVEVRAVRIFVADVACDQGVNRRFQPHHVEVTTVHNGGVPRNTQLPFTRNGVPQESHVLVRFRLALCLVRRTPAALQVAAGHEQRHPPIRMAFDQCGELPRHRRVRGKDVALGGNHQIPVVFYHVP